MRLYAFQGTRYAGPADIAGRLAAPPYDQIDATLRATLHASSSRQFAHLITPLPVDGIDAYAHAAVQHSTWRSDGTLVRDAEPALYPYVIIMPGGRRRFGITGLVGYEDPATGIIRPHEQTLDKAVADRTALLDATKVDLEPVLLIADDAGALDRLVAADVRRATPLTSHVDADANLHLLYKLTDPIRIAAYRETLASRTCAIADGHHRYKVGQRYATRTHAKPGSAAAAKLAVVTSVASPELTIEPIHRALRRLPDLSPARPLARRVDLARPADGETFAAAVAAAPQPSIGLLTREGAELWQLDPAHAPATVGRDSAELAVVLLQEALYPALGLATTAATDGTVVYRADPTTLWHQVREATDKTELALGVYLPPMLPAQFAAAIAKGAMLPAKSTRFLPKVMSGLVWAEHATGVG